MAGGRPRNFNYPEDKMIALGEEMIAWVKLNEAKILHLSEWYTIEKGFTYNEWKMFIQREEFFPYYEQAMRIVGRKYLDKNSSVRDSISHRWQRIYFKDLREQEDQDKEDEVERQKKVNKDATNAGEQLIKILIDKATDKSRDIVKDQQDA